MIKFDFEYDKNVKALINEIYSINPCIDLEIVPNYCGVAKIYLESEPSVNKHKMFIKSTPSSEELIHELIHIKNMQSRKYNWSVFYNEKNLDSFENQMYICFASLYDHFIISKYLEAHGYKKKFDYWKDFLDNSSNDDNYMTLYLMCTHMAEEQDGIKVYKKRLAKKFSNTYKIATEIMKNYTCFDNYSEENMIMEIRKMFKVLAKYFPNL